MPFDLEELALVPMGLGLQAMGWISGSVAGLPGSVVHAGAMPPLALALIAFGGVWLCIWRRRWRFAGFSLVVLGIVLMLTQRSPDFLIDGDDRLMATRIESGEMWLSRSLPCAICRRYLAAPGGTRGIFGVAVAGRRTGASGYALRFTRLRARN